jgi:hypothetical protein
MAITVDIRNGSTKESMTETTTNTENPMVDNLRQRYDALTANIKEQREQSECGATPQLIAKALSWSSKTLDEAMGLARDAIDRLEAGEKGEIEIRECEIKGGKVDIREFTCRRG